MTIFKKDLLFLYLTNSCSKKTANLEKRKSLLLFRHHLLKVFLSFYVVYIDFRVPLFKRVVLCFRYLTRKGPQQTYITLERL